MKSSQTNAADKSDKASQGVEAEVTAYGSGNAAQVYFSLYPRKIKMSELEVAYPNMIAKLVEHEGIGLVFGYEDDDTVLVMGKTVPQSAHW